MSRIEYMVGGVWVWGTVVAWISDMGHAVAVIRGDNGLFCQRNLGEIRAIAS